MSRHEHCSTNPASSALKRLLSAAVAVMLFALAGCETGPVYKPREPGQAVGYTDQQLTANRYRVTFAGRSSTKREEVENYLLRRAAEVTLAAGYTHFVFDTRNTEAKTYYRQDFDTFADPYFRPGFGYGYGSYFGPRAWYWSTWPYDPFPPYLPSEIRPITSYSAYSEIVILNADQATGERNAISARELLDRLAPQVPAEAAKPAQPRG